MSQPPKVNKFILFAGLAVVLPLIWLLYSGFGKDPKAIPSELVTRKAPTWALADLDGNPHSYEDLRGQPVVLNFWATWCGPCKMEHPMLLSAQDAYPDVKFYGIIYSDTPAKAKVYLARAGTNYPQLHDAGNRVSIDYGVTGVPETYFIDRSGTVVYKHAGPLVDPDLFKAKLNLIMSK